MGAADRNVNILVKAKDDASKAINGVGLSLGGIAIAATAAAAALAAVVAVMTKVTKLASTQEDADVKLAFALRSIGENTDKARASLFAFASELQNLTGIGDEVIESMIGTLAQVGRLGGTELKRATVATLDLSRAMGIDLKAAAILMAKAAAGDTSALSRYGLKLDETIPQTEKFAALLELVETNFGGSAEAAGKTFSGSLAKLSSAFGDMLEKLGGGIAKSETLRIAMNAAVDGLVALGAIIEENQPLITAMVDKILIASVGFLELSASIAQVTPRWIKLFGSIAKFAPGSLGLAGNAAVTFSKISEDSFASFEKGTQDLIDRLQKLRIELEAARGKTTDVARDVGNLVTAAALFDPFKKLPDLGLESFDDLLLKAAAIQKEFQDLQARKHLLPAAFFQKSLDSLAVMALELNALDIQVRDFANVSAEEAQRLLDAMSASAEKANEAAKSLQEQFVDRFGPEALRVTQQFGDALVQAAVTGQLTFKTFIKGLLIDLARARLQALLLKAALSFGGGGGGFFGFGGKGGVPIGLQHGGLIRGGTAGRDSVVARLTPGEVVLTPEVGAGFVALAQEIRRSRDRGGARALPDGGLQMFNQIRPAPDRLQDAITMVESINELAERHGMKVVSTELVGA